jgi:hypothetical protein
MSEPTDSCLRCCLLLFGLFRLIGAYDQAEHKITACSPSLPPSLVSELSRQAHLVAAGVNRLPPTHGANALLVRTVVAVIHLNHHLGLADTARPLRRQPHLRSLLPLQRLVW